MNYLQYKSSEMFSSTQLIRKSKTIFDKIETKEIEKAVILRDGKPSFIMLDFELYELLMAEYIKLKTLKTKQDKDLNKLDLELNEVNIKDKESETKDREVVSDEKQIDAIDKVHEDKSTLLDKLDSIEGIIINDTNEKPKNFKEFWE